MKKFVLSRVRRSAKLSLHRMSSTTKTSTKTPPSEGEEKKKSKLEKIFELQADRKRLEEENKTLHKQLERGSERPKQAMKRNSWQL